ncbi:hypothetical protein J7E24_16100 [Hymenobacter sp. ISL-91]|uniref:hypothetical protein n=1 Tax=Hymenobacter sp. ISL-91 TaxID=2819151 RepID=UPI001BEC214F|nr:hypothetical protein [Hymenobacter sp. ISL-91]MBT2559312.1 hypothetical protein [Hymenobacter sp. ISL-91]
MRSVLLVTFDQIYQEPILPKEEYLVGIDRETLLRIASYLLNLHAAEDFRVTFPRIFGSHSRDEATRIFRRLEQLERTSHSMISIIAPESALKLFQLIFPRPDEPCTQSEAEMEGNIFRLFFAVNSEVVAAENTSLDNAPELPGVDPIARLALLNSHARFDITHEGVERLMISQMAKSIQLFTFMEEREKYHLLLAAFLEAFRCGTWQEYSQRIFSLIKLIWDQISSNSTGTIIVKEEDDRIFLDNFILAEGAHVITDDYFSVRERPLFKVANDEYVVVYPRFVVEMLHKGLYWRFQKLNEDSSRTLLGGQDWAGLYKKEFSEEYLLNPILDSILTKQGTAISGKELEDSGVLAADGHVEPDYYFKATKRVILLESKDVNINKLFKNGDDFNGFVEELRDKFYRRSSAPVTNKLKKTAVLQLLRNIQRLLSGVPKFDKPIAQPAQLIIYPILLVHDSFYNMPGLNAVVDSWLQQELIRLRHEGIIAVHGRIRPLTIIDIDTLITYQDPFAENKL